MLLKNFWIPEKMYFPDVACSDKFGKGAGAFCHKMVVKHFNLNVSAGDAVVTVTAGIHDQLGQTEFRKPRYCDEASIRTEESMFLYIHVIPNITIAQ